MHRLNGRRSMIVYIVYIGDKSKGMHRVNGRRNIIVYIVYTGG